MYDVSGLLIIFMLAAFGIIALLTGIELRRSKLRHFPGPLGFPLIGHVPYLTKEPWVKFSYWAGVHGPVYQLVSEITYRYSNTWPSNTTGTYISYGTLSFVTRLISN